MKRFAMSQSNYISWKGYFDLIRASDVFVICDEVQYTKQDWRNRNLIKTHAGVKWLVIPVSCPKGKPGYVEDYVVVDPRWAKKHWKTIRMEYQKAPYLHEYEEFFENLYGSFGEHTLSQINERFIRCICQLFSIKTEILRSNALELPQDRNQRIVMAGKKLGMDTYLSGPAAKAYLDQDIFSEEGIQIQFADYSGYPEYNQPYPPFVHQVSILDLIFSEGPKAIQFMKTVA